MKPARRKNIVILLIFIVIIAAVLGFYLRANSQWQEDYKQKVASGTVQLLQNNPYDQTAVVVIVIDGLRWQEGIGDEDHEFIPHIWNELVPKGTLLTNYWIASPTVTTSVHSAMMTGRISTVPNDGHIRPVFPTYMELFRDARSDYVEAQIAELVTYPPFPENIFRPTGSTLNEINGLLSEAREFGPEKTPMYLGKDLIYSLNQSSSGRFPAEDILLVDSMRDIEVTEFFRAKIPDVHPNMVFINLGDVDEAGHEAEWPYYADSIRWADQHVWEMWQALQAESRYRDKTYFIITTDHGRHTPERGGYPHHGCFCDGCRHSFMLLIGPGIKDGFISEERHSELDLAPTIGKIMGFRTPATHGNPISEIFEYNASLPEPRTTANTALVIEDREAVDNRIPQQVLMGNILRGINDGTTGDIEELALLALAVSKNDPLVLTDETQVDLVKERYDLTIDGPEDLPKIYPSYLLNFQPDWTVPTTTPSVTGHVAWHWIRFEDHAKAFGVMNEEGEFDVSDYSVPERVLIALSLMQKKYHGDRRPPDTSRATAILLDILAEYEGEDRVYNMEFEDFIDDFRYREGPNEIFTEKEISMRDRMWLLWGIDQVVNSWGWNFTNPESDDLLRRQHRLLIAFMHEWQDANAMVGGTGDLGEEIDFVAQGLALSVLSDFKPWRRWELDELGYDMDIYRTPLFSWPPHHFFYIVGQGNALAGGWAANERLKLFVLDDCIIRHDLLDQGDPLKPGDEGYIEAAAALAYGFARFELADYDSFDLELYPIVHQQDD